MTATPNHALNLICLIGFFLLPAVLLGFRVRRPSLMRWWLLLVLSAALSWLLANGAVHFYYAHLDDLLRASGDHPSKQLLDTRSADGAKLVFALFFGWAYGLIYLIPWLLIYALFHICRHLCRSRQYA